MSLSSTSVFVIVEGDRFPPFRATLRDADGTAVPRAGVDADLIVQPVAGGAVTELPLTWEDAPTNTQVIHEWPSTLLPVGTYYGEVRTDPDGDEWTFPTETADLFTLIVRARLE